MDYKIHPSVCPPAKATGLKLLQIYTKDIFLECNPSSIAVFMVGVKGSQLMCRLGLMAGVATWINNASHQV